ncbi:MAG TPA: extracellular solute-binding protein [Stellaceae bacterium]|nr:extracellular solute-binding protein [Stellaceae bacterium]
MRRSAAFVLAAAIIVAGASAVAAADGAIGLSLVGTLKYQPGFTHFDYADPTAPKGGTMKLSAVGTFDTLNPFVIRGVPAAGISQIFDTLTTPAEDEPETDYGLVAKSIEVAPDKMSVLYTLRPEARFQDGSPITADDVIWTFNTLRAKGQPMYRSYYGDVVKAEKEGADGVRFYFRSANNRELAQIIGQMPVLSQKYWSGRDFEKTTLTPPLGSGPYRIAAIDPGRSITYKRDPNYWGRNLPVNKGRYNIDTIRYDYYRDGTVALQAFNAGQYDLRLENSSKAWATGYNSPAFRKGLIKKITVPNAFPSPAQGLGYNLRRPIFQDWRVRKALAYAFDFEWSNKNLFYGYYTRTRSYFDNSALAATGVPQGDELKILEPYRSQLPPEVFTTEYNPPHYDGTGNIRDGLRKAIALLHDAGWSFKNEKLVNDKSGQPFTFEILNQDPQMERIILPFIKNLSRLGITATLRTVDTAQYQRLMDTFDFDMTTVVFPQSLSPGNEERDFFGSATADQQGSRNLLGIKSPVIDALIQGLVQAPDRATLVAYTHDLDRVLQYGYYMVPQFHLGAYWIAYWDKFRRPAVVPKYGVGLSTWWVDLAAQKAIDAERGQGTQ